MVKGDSSCLKSDKVFDFLDIKPIVRKVCDSLDHKLILPTENRWIEIEDRGSNYNLLIKGGASFSFPKGDILLLPLQNISAERLAMHISYKIIDLIKEEFGFSFSSLEVEVEETSGQSATFINRGER
jgi:6-pyruvoyltetrahydropterin/6-carboxytetrahydropterin synthase